MPGRQRYAARDEERSVTTTDSEKVSPPAGKPNKGTDAGKTDADRLPARPGHAQRAGAFGFPVHPQRSAATGEVHARPAPSITAPRALLKLCFITDGGASVDQAVLAELSRQHGVAPPAETARHHRIRTGPGSLWWERHTEASTYLWEGPLPEAAGETLTGHPFGDAFPAPGSLIAGVRIDIRPHGDGYEKWLQAFDRQTLCLSQTEGGRAIVATDFRQDQDGLTRILILDKGMTPQRTGSLAQRLFDIEIYRTMAMLGLPVAQSLSPRMRKAEDRLAELTHRMREIEPGGAEVLLDEIIGLAGQLEADAASSLYRFGASRAYDEIVSDRLSALDEDSVPGYDTWRSFLERRLAPAMRTCRAVEERQANLSRKLARAANLLRTRIDVEVEKQNRDLLESMDRRAKLQLRLQQTVEGLSVAAVSYYIVGLFAYAIKGVPGRLPGLSTDALTALFVPVTILSIWWIVRRIRQRHLGRDKTAD
ncbi:MAG: DUF3422 family protein [Roseitalea sp.]|jgi:uncharacterized membrane-anchored protein|uniref:DUF3422 family protein n=1 Tax=Oceaniradius stylonematis TaxID=2184161 RepID=A0A3A8A9M4_9HYPH|nr:DUF3422 family protein [Roseitalea sp.]MBO6952682.1 DUF3422 family protein [Rhizobiaceae bacterium]RKF07042.1 DUF3422 family protein [Oceaniradius stylonematis]RNC96387.1 MAG: DUF3422 family protein [Oricola sp.]MBO6592831.1 DUF3422 family protein [Roseitalea sp.]